MNKESLKKIVDKYDQPQIDKIKDFLISEIDADNIDETVDFVLLNDEQKTKKYADLLYSGEDFTGVLLEGSQYLISSTDEEVNIIDYIGYTHGLVKNVSVQLDKSDFIYLISHKKEAITYYG